MGSMKNHLSILGILVPILLIQGAWIFYDSRKRKEKYYWLWGIFGLLNVPSSLIIYLLVTRVILNKQRKK
ncbi:MAG TPA: hypothetical protein DEF85_07200 [Clostridiaceae bacterium]|jgi:hypothetical protein|nr:hypothetical protein [Clostridiaceae bacterium]